MGLAAGGSFGCWVLLGWSEEKGEGGIWRGGHGRERTSAEGSPDLEGIEGRGIVASRCTPFLMIRTFLKEQLERTDDGEERRRGSR